MSSSADSQMGSGPADSQQSENWLIEKSLKCLEDGKIQEARVWILTAKSLYPKDFKVQYGLLQIQITAKQFQDAAVLLSALLDSFPDQKTLWDLVEQVVNAVELRWQNVSLDADILTLVSLYTEMDSQQQKKLIMRFAEHVNSTTPLYCRVLMLLMRLHPDTVQSCALQAIDSVKKSIKKTESPSCSEAWQTLVVDLLPAILSSQHVHVASSDSTSSPADHLVISRSTVYEWLEWMLLYYFDVALNRSTSSLGGTAAAVAGLLSPTRTRRFSIDGQAIEVCNETQPWKSAWHQLLSIASLCQWTSVLNDNLLDKNLVLLERVERLQSLVASLTDLSKPNVSKDTRNKVILPVFYTCILVWLEACWSYSHPAAAPGQPPPKLILLDLPQPDRTEPHPGGEPRAKRSKRSESDGDLPIRVSLHQDLPASCNVVAEQFRAAYSSWQLLNDVSALNREYTRLVSDWSSHGTEWHWLGGFERDVMLYNGDMEGLRKCADSAAEDSSTGASLQCSFALFAGGQQEKACRQILKIFNELPPDEPNMLTPIGQRHQARSTDANAQCRELQLTPCTASALLPLVVRVLICYYESKGISATTKDAVLGHVLVLCQYGWPKYDPLVSRISEIIQGKGSFSYVQAFDYIVNVDILEELSYLHNTGCKLSLLTGNGNPTKRTVTRGVNKGAKEEIRSAIERQVVHVDSSARAVNARLVRFLKEAKLIVK